MLAELVKAAHTDQWLRKVLQIYKKHVLPLNVNLPAINAVFIKANRFKLNLVPL